MNKLKKIGAVIFIVGVAVICMPGIPKAAALPAIVVGLVMLVVGLFQNSGGKGPKGR